MGYTGATNYPLPPVLSTEHPRRAAVQALAIVSQEVIWMAQAAVLAARSGPALRRQLDREGWGTNVICCSLGAAIWGNRRFLRVESH